MRSSERGRVQGQGKRLVGVLVGGQSRRMGGRPKGLLLCPDDSGRTLVARLVDEVRATGVASEVVLLGRRSEYQECAEKLGLVRLRDAQEDSGPLAGLVALLRYGKKHGYPSAIVLGCDLPHLRSRLIDRIAREEPEGLALCPKQGDKYQPLVARYSVDCLPHLESALQSNRLSLQPLLRTLDARELFISKQEEDQLADWDTTGDVRRS